MPIWNSRKSLSWSSSICIAIINFANFQWNFASWCYLEALSPMQGQFKDEFVTAGGVPLSEVCALVSVSWNKKEYFMLFLFFLFLLFTLQVSINTMESKIRPNLFFAGEVTYWVSIVCLAIYLMKYITRFGLCCRY